MDKTQVIALLKSKAVVGSAIGLAAGGVGVAVGYAIAYKKLDATFQKRMDEEIEDTKRFYKSLSKKDFPSPLDALDKLQNGMQTIVEDMVVDLEYAPDGDELVEVARNVFTNATDFDFDEEMKKRGPDTPYILEHDEFYNSDLQSSTLTYFLGDNVLSDDRDEHIPDIDAIVGENNLTKFGHGSRDPNILYIRNERIDVDFEVILDQGNYTEKVLGFVQHNEHYPVRRFKIKDE